MYFVVFCVVFYFNICECLWYIKINFVCYIYFYIVILVLYWYYCDIVCVCNNFGVIFLF